MHKVPKAKADDFHGRYREIISDPLNILIKRHAFAGQKNDGEVVLHNGLSVPLSGDFAYYGNFSDILILNRGVHEPLEEFVFQTLLKNLNNQQISMLELGAYWGHYSMWLLLNRPDSKVTLVEPEEQNLQAGKLNFQRNNFEGTFIKDFVGKGDFEVDDYLAENDISHLTILHSDIQGYEVEMLSGAAQSLKSQSIDYVMVSTHSEALHREVENELSKFGYVIEVTSSFERRTTSFDGFIFARKPSLEPIFNGFKFLGREELTEISPLEKIEYLKQLKRFA